ncbi:MAG TPA: arginine--tRNA ligase [Armatimonadetes bacterium]|nr:arginine--tRNA ligase [Armatimonadota bacterium]
MMERELSEMLLEAAGRWARSKGLKIPEGTRPVVERPPRPELGDYATNFALHLAKALGMKPREVAEGIVANLPGSPYIESVEVAGPGFINFRLNPAWVGEVIKRVLAEGERYGAVDVGKGRKVQVEFVSANPTGPLHIGHGRGAAIGDVIARLLEFTGHKVTREYYINDAERSRQMRLFAESLEARYLQVLGKESELPPDGYHGEYILDIARRIAEEHGERFLQMSREERLRALMRIGRDMMVKEHREDLERFRVRFDVWPDFLSNSMASQISPES